MQQCIIKNGLTSHRDRAKEIIYWLVLSFTLLHSEVNVYVYDPAGYLIGAYYTIQDGINACPDGGSVVVSPGTYTGDSNKNLSWFGKCIKVIGNGAVIDCENDGRGFYLKDKTLNDIIVGFVIINGTVIDDNGGGIYIENGSPIIRNCTITQCHAQGEWPAGRGGGIYLKNAPCIIQNCKIFSNTADRYGGGIFCDENSSAQIINSVITNNIAMKGGGGIHCDNSSPKIINCLISDNHTINESGGGIYCYNNSGPQIINCTIINNSAASNGGGIFCGYYSSVGVTNCIVAYNTGEGIWIGLDSSANLDYNCFWANIPKNYENCSPGANHRDINPQFIDEYGRLQPISPCIDKGLNFAIIDFATDLDGNPRIINNIVDIGAYEYQK